MIACRAQVKKLLAEMIVVRLLIKFRASRFVVVAVVWRAS